MKRAWLLGSMNFACTKCRTRASLRVRSQRNLANWLHKAQLECPGCGQPMRRYGSLARDSNQGPNGPFRKPRLPELAS